MIDIEGHRLWVRLAGRGSPTVVFENGGGDDSRVWEGIEPRVRNLVHVRTLVYDRAGIGKSELLTTSYSIDNEAATLRSVLDELGVEGPIVLVAHSYGAFVATLVAATDARIAGAVFVDASLPDFFTDGITARLMRRYLSRLEELAREQPKRAQAIRPMIEAYHATVVRMRQVPFPSEVPAIDIVSERTPFENRAEATAWRRAHATFAAQSPTRKAVLAVGSGHMIMHDRSQLVLDAVRRMVNIVRRASEPRSSRRELPHVHPRRAVEGPHRRGAKGEISTQG